MRRGRGGARPEPGWKSPFESSDLSAWLAGKVKVLGTYALVSLLAFYPIKIPAGVSGAAPPASWVLRGSGTRSPCAKRPKRLVVALVLGTEPGAGPGAIRPQTLGLTSCSSLMVIGLSASNFKGLRGC